jgi:hypothetical protein
MCQRLIYKDLFLKLGIRKTCNFPEKSQIPNNVHMYDHVTVLWSYKVLHFSNFTIQGLELWCLIPLQQ